MTIYDFTVMDSRRNEVPMSQYQGKVLLIVNTDRGCGFAPQYEELEELYEKYHNMGLEILDFPCNQFLNEDLGTPEENSNIVKEKYGTTFPTFAQLEVNGREAHPLYEFLRDNSPEGPVPRLKWNFNKFLVSRNGMVLGRFAAAVHPRDLETELEKVLISEGV
ncbi:MAG: glutathione peroxidase [Clostridia bacterium]|nr:glutathione peroxidase [Clostridia bacterium]